jgi:hypothetical protein
MEALDSYYVRIWRRFRRDATPWARDNIFWGALALVIPPLFVYARDRHAPIDWNLLRAALWWYGFILLIYVLAHLCRVPLKLDQERNTREVVLEREISDRDATIKGLTERPKYSAAEQHDYDTAKKSLQLLGEKGINAMRHIRRQGALTFAFGASSGPLPPGLSLNDTLWVYNQCASEGLLTCKEKYGSGEKTFAISTKMEKILDDLLYDESLKKPTTSS